MSCAVDHFEAEGLEGTLAEVDAPDAFRKCHGRVSPVLRVGRRLLPVLRRGVAVDERRTQVCNGSTVAIDGSSGSCRRCVTCSRGLFGPATGRLSGVGRTAWSFRVVARPPSDSRYHPIRRLSTNTTPDGRKCWRGFTVPGRKQWHADDADERQDQEDQKEPIDFCLIRLHPVFHPRHPRAIASHAGRRRSFRQRSGRGRSGQPTQVPARWCRRQCARPTRPRSASRR